MLYAFAALLAFQWAGEVLAQSLQLPLPGALLGALLLLMALLAYGRLPVPLAQTAQGLLQHMMLLFIPTITAVMLQLQRLSQEWLPFVVAGVVGAAITFAVTAWTLQWLLARQPQADA